MAENEKGAIAGENAGSIGINEGTIHNGNVSESSRQGSTNGDDQVSSTAEELAREIQSSRQAKNPNPPSEAEKIAMVAEYVKQAIAKGLVAYDVYEIEKKYPKAFLGLQDYIDESANLPVDKDSLVGIMLYSGRTVVFSFFDRQQIFVNILGYEDKWYYTIEKLCQSTETYKTRTECEIAAFMQAFAEFENRLNYRPKN